MYIKILITYVEQSSENYFDQSTDTDTSHFKKKF